MTTPPFHPHALLVNAMVEKGFDPDGAAYGDIAKFVLDTLDMAGYTLVKRTKPGPPPPCLGCGKPSDEGGWCHPCWYEGPAESGASRQEGDRA